MREWSTAVEHGRSRIVIGMKLTGKSRFDERCVEDISPFAMVPEFHDHHFLVGGELPIVFSAAVVHHHKVEATCERISNLG